MWISWGRGVVGNSLNYNANFEMWKPPDKDYIKLNVDGACRRGRTSCNGVLRDYMGVVKGGFLFNIRYGDSLMADSYGTRMELGYAYKAFGYRIRFFGNY